MSMALALEGIQNWLRDRNGWKPNECGVQYDALPGFDSGQFYVAIDDAGVEAGSPNTNSIKETLSITIGIWKRPEHLAGMRKGQLKLPLDKYLLGSWTLHQLERQVIIRQLHGLHANYEFMNYLNSINFLPDDLEGAKFNQPLFYGGRGRMDTVAVDAKGLSDPVAWIGYRLRFRGLVREQRLGNSPTPYAEG